MTEKTASKKILDWKAKNWPPEGLHPYEDLPLYWGTKGETERFCKVFSEFRNELIQPYANENGSNEPRWMKLPKYHEGVCRVSILDAESKESRRFKTIDELVLRCGGLIGDGETKILKELLRLPGSDIVAHRVRKDLRAYIYQSLDSPPKRIRFFWGGLVLATSQDAISSFVDDRRTVVRRKRQDAYGVPTAETAKGWMVYVINKASPHAEDQS